MAYTRVQNIDFQTKILTSSHMSEMSRAEFCFMFKIAITPKE